MPHRPAQVYTGSGWDDIGDSRLITHNHGGGANGANIPQSSVTNLTSDLGSKVDYPSGGADGDALIKSGTAAAWGAAGGLTLITSESFSAVSSVSVNGCFTATYTNYRLILRASHSNTSELRMRVRAAGSDNSGSNYATIGAIAFDVGTPTIAASSTGTITNWRLAFDHTEYYAALDIYDVNLAAVTMMLGLTTRRSGGATIFSQWQHTAASAFDGFTLFPSTNTFSGEIRVYGYRN